MLTINDEDEVEIKVRIKTKTLGRIELISQKEDRDIDLLEIIEEWIEDRHKRKHKNNDDD